MNLHNRLGLQSCKHNDLLLEEEIHYTIKNNFKVFEIFFDGFMPWDVPLRTRDYIRKIAMENSMTLQVHGAIEKTENLYYELKETIDFCEDVGSSLLTIHPVLEYMNIYEKILQEALEKNVYISIENYKINRNFATPEDMKEIYKLFSHYPNTGITFDTGHANIVCNPAFYLKSLPQKKILNIHIHDNSGKADNHLPMGEGNINFPELIDALKSINYSGNFIIEHWDKNIFSANYFKQLW